MGTIDSASPWCSWLSSQCLPWLPGLRLRKAGGRGATEGLPQACRPGLGGPSVSQETA